MQHIARRNLQNKPPLSIPPGLDPDRFPIVTQHVYGIDPAELRLQRQAERVHALGPRPFFEFCRELAEAHDIGADMQRRLAKYARLDPALIRALGADHFPPPPLHEVEPRDADPGQLQSQGHAAGP